MTVLVLAWWKVRSSPSFYGLDFAGRQATTPCPRCFAISTRLTNHSHRVVINWVVVWRRLLAVLGEGRWANQWGLYGVLIGTHIWICCLMNSDDVVLENTIRLCGNCPYASNYEPQGFCVMHSVLEAFWVQAAKFSMDFSFWSVLGQAASFC